jgi:hypothetical protein
VRGKERLLSVTLSCRIVNDLLGWILDIPKLASKVVKKVVFHLYCYSAILPQTKVTILKYSLR